MDLRLATWNCRQAVDRKRALFDRLAADVIVVPECSQSPRFSREPGVSFAWRGRNANLGLGVFALNGWTVASVPELDPLPWVLPLQLIAPTGEDAALLLAIWAVATPENPPYETQVARAVEAWELELATGPVVFAGDTNCSPQSGDREAHLANIARLDDLGVASCYHQHHGLAHGDENHMTLSWVGRGGVRSGSHCDFVFASADLIARLAGVTVGRFDEWIGPQSSDHAPVVCAFTV